MNRLRYKNKLSENNSGNENNSGKIGNRSNSSKNRLRYKFNHIIPAPSKIPAQITDVALSALILLVVISLTMPVQAGEYSMFHYDPMRTGNVDGTGPVKNVVKWETSLGGLIASSPVVSDGRVFISNWLVNWTKGNLYCLNESSGEILWSNDLGGKGSASTAAVSGNLVFVGSLSGDLYCINASCGETIWNKKIENNPGYWGVASSPLLYQDMVFVTTFSDGVLHVFDFDGNKSWNFSTSSFSTNPNPVQWYVSPSAMGNTVFFVSNVSMSNVNGSGTNIGQNISRDTIFAVDISTHEKIWNFSVEEMITTTPVIWKPDLRIAITQNTTDETIVHTNNTIATTNETIVTTNETIITTNNTMVNEVVTNILIFATEKGLYAIDASNGNELWHNSFSSKMSSPAVDDCWLYIGSDNGNLYSFSILNGSLNWKFNANGQIYSSPVVAENDVVYF